MEKPKKSPDSGKKNEAKGKLKPPEYSKELVSQHEVQYLTRCTRFRLSTEYELSICNCKHIMRMTIGERHSVVNPQKWLCNICYTTESVWACLSCPNVACGRYIHEHALNHYLESLHPLVIDVNELYVYCYECEEYVLNDNKSGDLKVLRETLQAIRNQDFTGTTRSGHTLRTAAITADEDVQMRRKLQQQQLDRDDRNITAIWHSRFVRQRKIFRHWLDYVRNKKKYSIDVESDDERTLKEFIKARHSQRAVTSVSSNESSIPIASSRNVSVEPLTHASNDVPSTRTAGEILPTTFTAENISTNASDVSSSGIISDCGSHTPPNERSIINTDAKSTSKVLSVPPKIFYVQSPKKQIVTAAGVRPAEVLDLTKVLKSETYRNKILVLKSDSTSPAHSVNSQKSFKILYPTPEKKEKLISAKTDMVIMLADEETDQSEESAQPSFKNSFNFSVENKSETPVHPTTDATPPSHKETKEESASNVCSSDQSDTEPQTPSTCNVQRRSKRINAASRYKQIMHQLTPSQNEPVEKRLRLSDHINVADIRSSTHQPRRSLRLSLRLMKTNKAKTAKEARRQNKLKKALSKKQFKGERRRSKTERTLPSRKMPSRRSRLESASKSLYDSVPNRAVTSLIPGVTGLRNLGNTCYLNSIIQVLGHLQKFRRCLLAVRDLEIDDNLPFTSDVKTTAPKLRISGRRSTVEMYESQTSQSISRRLLRMQAGLNGGRESRSPDKSREVEAAFNTKQRLFSNTSQPNSLSLCHELHDLYHIMWSGKWKLVSPYHFLSSVWQLIPSFRGYSQQDAQEFLCELLDKIVSELERRRHSQVSKPERLAARISAVVHAVFEGRLHSQVRCLECKNVSSTYEPFWDLSLEFPQRYHSATSSSWKNSNQGCSLSEMLVKFTEAEKLDGGRVYSCSHCNGLHLPHAKEGGRRRRLSSRKPAQKLSEAEKQIKIIELPQILRFHLKRFRWSGRNNREKIIVPVHFPSELDMKPHCWINEHNADDHTMYDLSAVVIHHGRGFGSGHYTAYCWNDIGKFWVHCNDSNLELCSIDDVMAAQAYILFYSQRGLDPHPHVFTPPSTPDLSPPLTPNISLNPEDPGNDLVFDDPGKG